MNIYADDAQLKLDERQLSEQLGISRTPIREALARLEQEGLVTVIPRRGVFIVRKTRKEILEMITLWAALESMACRLITERASDEDIASLRKIFTAFENGHVPIGIASCRVRACKCGYISGDTGPFKKKKPTST